jgi:nitronate monooxygenase
MPLPVFFNAQPELPVVGSQLFIFAGPELVIAQCKAGLVGSFPRSAGARPKSATNG